MVRQALAGDPCPVRAGHAWSSVAPIPLQEAHQRCLPKASPDAFSRPISTPPSEVGLWPSTAYLLGSARERDPTSILKLTGTFGGKRLTEITPAAVERYITLRTDSMTIHGCHPTPATVNRELACLKHVFNVARKGLIELKGGVPAEKPVSAVTFLDEQNVRDRVLTAAEFQRMLGVSPDYLRPALICAYYTGMRKEVQGGFATPAALRST
jgi:hypothetical protein